MSGKRTIVVAFALCLAALTLLCCQAAADEEGEEVFKQVIRDHPDRAQGYVHLADALDYRGRHREAPADLERAIEVLQQALDRPVVDAADFDLQARIEYLREDLARAKDEGPSG